MCVWKYLLFAKTKQLVKHTHPCKQQQVLFSFVNIVVTYVVGCEHVIHRYCGKYEAANMTAACGGEHKTHDGGRPWGVLLECAWCA